MSAQLLGDNLLTISSSRLQSSVVAEIPEIKELIVSRKWPHGLKVQVVEREPSLAWKSGGVLYLLDADGTVIQPITDKLGRLPVVVDTTNLPVRVGNRVVGSGFVSFALGVVKGINGLSLPLDQLSITDSTSELTAQLKTSYAIKFDTTRPVAPQIGDLRKVLAELSKEGKKPAEYIDLRVDGKAYYK